MPGQTNVSWLRYAGLGLELAAAVAAGTAGGWWVDHRFATAPWGVLGGSLLGMTAGMVNLVRRALGATRDQGSKD